MPRNINAMYPICVALIRKGVKIMLYSKRNHEKYLTLAMHQLAHVN